MKNKMTKGTVIAWVIAIIMTLGLGVNIISSKMASEYMIKENNDYLVIESISARNEIRHGLGTIHEVLGRNLDLNFSEKDMDELLDGFGKLVNVSNREVPKLKNISNNRNYDIYSNLNKMYGELKIFNTHFAYAIDYKNDKALKNAMTSIEKITAYLNYIDGL